MQRCRRRQPFFSYMWPASGVVNMNTHSQEEGQADCVCVRERGGQTHLLEAAAMLLEEEEDGELRSSR